VATLRVRAPANRQGGVLRESSPDALTFQHCAAEVPGSFRTVALQSERDIGILKTFLTRLSKARNTTSSYREEDDSSLDGSLTRLALVGSSYDLPVVKNADFR